MAWQMEDYWLSNMILFGELKQIKAPLAGLCVSGQSAYLIQPDWHVLALSRAKWWDILFVGTKALDESLNNKGKLHHACQKGLSSQLKNKCMICNKYFTSGHYLHSHHIQKHGPKYSFGHSTTSCELCQVNLVFLVQQCDVHSLQNQRRVFINILLGCKHKHSQDTLFISHIAQPISSVFFITLHMSCARLSFSCHQGIKMHLWEYGSLMSASN